MKYSQHFNTKNTSQTEPIPGKKMVKNKAGGYGFETSKWEQLRRFLVLGSEGGTYYVAEKKLTVANAQNVIECIKEDGLRAVETIVEYSVSGRAIKNETAIFALALAATFGDATTKQMSYQAIAKVCRTGTHLFSFADAVQSLRGWSRGLRNGVAKFYLEKGTIGSAYQVIKYRQRNGWTHRDIMRLSHPKTKDPVLNSVFRYAVGKEVNASDLPKAIQAFETIKTLNQLTDENEKRAIELILEFRLPREALPTELLNSPIIWSALLRDMPLTAMIRNLGVMTVKNVLQNNFDDNTKTVVSKLNRDSIKAARVHPMAILVALKTYQQGRGDKGSLVWKPIQAIVDALDEAFYLAFENVEPTNNNTLIALDVSGSMQGASISGTNLTAREASAAMAMVTARTEPNHQIMAFSQNFIEVKFSKKARLDQVVRELAQMPFDATDCSLPILYAMENNLPIDTFIVYTDNETWSGNVHPKQALDQYRKKSGRSAKLIVVGMTATNISIADPSDVGMLDIVGFDTSAPLLMREFVVGR